MIKEFDVNIMFFGWSQLMSGHIGTGWGWLCFQFVSAAPISMSTTAAAMTIASHIKTIGAEP